MPKRDFATRSRSGKIRRPLSERAARLISGCSRRDRYSEFKVSKPVARQEFRRGIPFLHFRFSDDITINNNYLGDDLNNSRECRTIFVIRTFNWIKLHGTFEANWLRTSVQGEGCRKWTDCKTRHGTGGLTDCEWKMPQVRRIIIETIRDQRQRASIIVFLAGEIVRPR